MIWLQITTVFWLGGGTISLSYKSPCIDQIPTELIKAGSRTIGYDIHKLNNSVWIKEKLLEGWKKSIILLMNKKGVKQAVVIIEAHHCC